MTRLIVTLHALNAVVASIDLLIGWEPKYGAVLIVMANFSAALGWHLVLLREKA